MCGIVGIVHRDPAHPVSQEAVQAMCRAIRHRGPDDEGFYIGENAGLGMRRLSIIDLAGGHQPIFNEDESRVIVYNGEIYNYQELRPLLEQGGHTLQTESDTECVLHLHEDRGPRCLDALRGMFAFAIWDRRQRSLFLARDRFGIKPLYYVEAPWGLAFSSELKALVAVGLTAGQLDWGAIDMFFQLGYIPAPHAPFQDVRKLPPGHWLEWTPERGLQIERYWDLPQDTRVPEHDLVEHLLDTFDDTVKAHMVSDVPVAAFLSGGLDSSAVVSSMARDGATPHAFTARYHGSGAETADEVPLATALADRYGARLTVIDVEPDVADVFEDIVGALDEPHADESAIPSWLVSQAVAQEYKVALSGTGGDELFAGYRRHLGLMAGEWYSHVPRVLRRTAHRLAQAIPEPEDGGLGVDRIKRFLRADGGTVERYLGYLSKLTDAAREGLYRPDLIPPGSPNVGDHFASLYQAAGAPGGVRAGLYLDYKTYLPDDILALSDRLSMAHSLEVRVPFVDHRLVEAAFPLPDRTRIGWGKPKKLLAAMLESRLPPGHFQAPKRGFVGPTAAWLRHELRELLTDELSGGRLAKLGFFRQDSVDALLDDHFTGRHNREGILWALLCFSTWHRLYVDRTPASPYLSTTAEPSG